MGETPTRIDATRTSLRIVQLIRDKDGARAAALVDELDVSKSTVHAHLTTLQECGYVTKQGEIYRLGLHLFHLGQHARIRDRRYRLARDKTVEVAESLHYAIDFDVETNGRMISLFHQADPSTEIGFEPGAYFHMHASGTGKATLALLPDERVDAIIERWDMPAKTDETITEPSVLRADIRRTRDRGYGLVDEEWLDGHRAVGVAVRLPDGRPFGALSAGGPKYRLTDETIRSEVAPALQDAAGALEEAIDETYR